MKTILRILSVAVLLPAATLRAGNPYIAIMSPAAISIKWSNTWSPHQAITVGGYGFGPGTTVTIASVPAHGYTETVKPTAINSAGTQMTFPLDVTGLNGTYSVTATRIINRNVDPSHYPPIILSSSAVPLAIQPPPLLTIISPPAHSAKFIKDVMQVMVGDIFALSVSCELTGYPPDIPANITTTPPNLLQIPNVSEIVIGGPPGSGINPPAVQLTAHALGGYPGTAMYGLALGSVQIAGPNGVWSDPFYVDVHNYSMQIEKQAVTTSQYYRMTPIEVGGNQTNNAENLTLSISETPSNVSASLSPQVDYTQNVPQAGKTAIVQLAPSGAPGGLRTVWLYSHGQTGTVDLQLISNNTPIFPVLHVLVPAYP